jgi:hypothetical protein
MSIGRSAFWLATSVAAAACVATLAFALGTLPVRPLDGSEGNLLFDAARIRDHLPLYVDPLRGAWDYGPVPSRYYVLYTPLWSALLAALPASAAPFAGRALAAGAWFGLLTGIATGAPAPNRRAAMAGALFLGGAYPLTLFGAAARPDSLALLLAGLATIRCVRSGRVGAAEGALFALAAFVKPNVFAAGVGAIAMDVARRRGKAWPACVAAAVTSAACAAALHLASRGAWIEHLARSTQTSMSARLWIDQMGSRLPFFALPLGLAAWCAGRARAHVVLGALAASSAWTLWSLAKIGSASNYWMEPCVVGLAAIARLPLPSPGPVGRAAGGVVMIAQALWTGVAAVRSSLESIDAAPRARAAILASRARCGAGPSAIIIAEEAGIEEMVDGRVVQQPVELVHLTRLGKYPEDLWEADVRRREVRCLVMLSDLLERPASRVDVEHDLFGPPMRAALRSRFELVGQEAGVRWYRARD